MRKIYVLRGYNMSVSYCVKGLKPITEDYQKRLQIYQSCRELGIRPPDEIIHYFENDTEPCDEGIIVYLNKDVVAIGRNSYSNYYDVDLSKLPEGVAKVRFQISY